MTEERLKEIHDSIELQMQVQQSLGYKNRYDDLLVEEIDLYNEVIELQQERNNYKELYEKENKNWNELKETLKEEIKYDENWYNPDCVEYIGQKRYPDDTIDGFRYAVEKMEDLERL